MALDAADKRVERLSAEMLKLSLVKNNILLGFVAGKLMSDPHSPFWDYVEEFVDRFKPANATKGPESKQ